VQNYHLAFSLNACPGQFSIDDDFAYQQGSWVKELSE